MKRLAAVKGAVFGMLAGASAVFSLELLPSRPHIEFGPVVTTAWERIGDKWRLRIIYEDARRNRACNQFLVKRRFRHNGAAPPAEPRIVMTAQQMNVSAEFAPFQMYAEFPEELDPGEWAYLPLVWCDGKAVPPPAATWIWPPPLID
ncbi:MAG: hypothetical protein AAF762_00190 [Pseudomonadota bacterium]